MNTPNFGIEVVNTPKGIRGKSIGTEDIAVIKKVIREYKSSNTNMVDNMVANVRQNLTNKQIAQAYIHLGVYDQFKNTESVKRALRK